MGYQEDRAKRIEIFEDTIQYCERNQKLLTAIVDTRKNTRFYREPLQELDGTIGKRYEQPVKVSVSLKRTLEAASDLHLNDPEDRIGILNFASATNPGGGVIRGSNAQEESICRCTTLYPCLTTESLQKDYYTYHKKRRNPLYTDRCIFTPDILVFKTDEKWPKLCAEEEWFPVDVISCAAPNLRGEVQRECTDKVDMVKTEEQISELLRNRIRGILQVAVSQQMDILVLGAFGCGAFCNSPYIVAEAFKDVLKDYRYSFKKVEFAVYCTQTDRINYDVFSNVFLNA